MGTHDKDRPANRLAKETSPYLQQHAYNPVDWYPWGQEALQKAKAENKLLIVSIGYSACHWCHVMERESFEDNEVARLMNDHFVCVKVDREERPDVDALYMDAVNLMTGQGGWPLNAFALPDTRPVYAGTYFPKNQWLGLLRHMAFDYKREPEKFIAYADKLVEGIKGLSIVDVPKEEPAFNQELITNAYRSFYPNFDRTNGGKGRAPKFPMPDIYQFLLRYSYITGDTAAREQAFLTLDKMAKGGIYDQIGGGFARYSTDAKWLVPHFEKMLYDNAQLISLYAEGWQISKNPLYKKIVYQTIEFVERELMSAEGGFYCALDADSEGVEGKFYVWKEEEFDSVVDADDAPLLREYFGIGAEGYWEDGNNILVAARDIAILAEKYNLTETEVLQKIEKASAALLEERGKRIRPGLDNKVLLSWNALMLEGLLDAYRIFREPKFLSLAERNFELLQKNFIEGSQLYRTSKSGPSPIPGFLEDYAYLISALTAWYQVSFDESVLAEAKALMDYSLEAFGDENSLMFYFTSKSNSELVARKVDTSDNVMPSPNSVMAHNLFALSHYYDHGEYHARAEKMTAAILPQFQEFGLFYCNWGKLLCRFTTRFFDIAVTGPEAINLSLDLEREYHPMKLLSGDTDGKAALPLLQNKYREASNIIYVCEDKLCNQPVSSAQEALAQLGQA